MLFMTFRLFYLMIMFNQNYSLLQLPYAILKDTRSQRIDLQSKALSLFSKLVKAEDTLLDDGVSEEDWKIVLDLALGEDHVKELSAKVENVVQSDMDRKVLMSLPSVGIPLFGQP